MLEITLANTGPDIMKHLCNQKKKKRLCNNLQQWGIVIYLNRRHIWEKKIHLLKKFYLKGKEGDK